MGIFPKQEFNEETSEKMRDFWNWFRNNKENDIFQIMKEIQNRLREICNVTDNYFVGCEVGYDCHRGKGNITFWGDGYKYQRACYKKLVELAPNDIKDKWVLRTEN